MKVCAQSKEEVKRKKNIYIGWREHEAQHHVTLLAEYLYLVKTLYLVVAGIFV